MAQIVVREDDGATRATDLHRAYATTCSGTRETATRLKYRQLYLRSKDSERGRCDDYDCVELAGWQSRRTDDAEERADPHWCPQVARVFDVESA